ncbi:uncharacterized protein K02A2.6-like [Mercenaria mercenaria]|uniref:uncharacterized protein K02A2.6-like n=1 Tax=Mercenaria mercenaria TaxID=6596 RepID=UPI00234F3391|nr:uncharacterized protein K02A2.6-like [Mercenaria mercenaria]
MAGYIGKIEPYDENIDSWISYEERLVQYFSVNDIEDEKRVSALLTLIGGKTYSLLRNLCSPVKPADKSYDELTTLLKEHLAPKPLVIAERFRFHKRNQGTSESVHDYIAVLRKLSEHCDFGDTLNDTLRDRFVCGLREANIQKRLLSKTDLTLQKAIEEAVAMETAARDASELRTSAEQVHKTARFPVKTKKPEKPKQTPPLFDPCKHCGKTNHQANKCFFKNKKCYICKKTGHLKNVCKSNKVKSVSDEEYDINYVNSVRGRSSNKIWITPEIDNIPVKMELDTGSAVTLISKEEFQKLFGNKELDRPTSILRTYSGEEITQAGTKLVRVKVNDQSKMLRICVINEKGPALFGRDWLQQIQLDWKNILQVNTIDNNKLKSRLKEILDRHRSVFSEGIGKVKGMQASLSLKENTTPKFVKARPVPYSLKPKIEKELENLEQQGIISKVNNSDWATPIVPVVKANGNVRICGDFKVTVNQALKVDKYPLPRTEDIFANLSSGQKFSKLDLRQAYLHLEVDDKSKKLLTINTHKGLYSYSRLVYGISSAPSIWQRAIEQILQGIDGVQCILDDMVITGATNEEHFKNLDLVLTRLEQYGLRVNKDKCAFFQDRISYCGHDIDVSGLWKSQAKIGAILDTPRPTNVSSLRSYLGLLMYYHRFLPDISTVVKPLNELLEKNRKFEWNDKQERAFQNSKILLTKEPVLTHYNPDLPVRLATDASPVGISGILSHVMPDGSEKPIAFASRTLTKTEQKYAQVDREALAAYYFVKRFYTYLYGRKFTLIVDCQALLSIFSPQKQIAVTTAARVQRYALYLSGFNYDIEYKSTKKNSNVDALSRLPVRTQQEDCNDGADVFYTSQIEQLPVTSAQIARETRRDKILSRVYEEVQNGWNLSENDSVLKAYANRKSELSIHRGCLLWGIRVVIPTKLRKQILDLLHASHPGIVRMKNLARGYVWYPGIDKDLELLVKSCVGCQKQQKAPSAVNLHPWEWPSSPWERVHIDFAGPFLGRMFLIMVDAHSKWPEVIEMKSTTAERTIEVLRTVFSRNGLPTNIVSDNGTQFCSDIFAKFMKDNGILHLRSAPYNPSTNGLAERFVGHFKQSIRAMHFETGDFNQKLSCFLLRYRNTPHSTTNESPAKLFLGRSLRCRLDLVKPNTKRYVSDKQMKSSFSDDRKFREFEIGENVLARDYRGREKWIGGTIVSREGPLMYQVDVGYNIKWRRHANQLRKTEMIEPRSIDQPHETDMDLSKSLPQNNPTYSPENLNNQAQGDQKTVHEKQDSTQKTTDNTPVVINSKQDIVSERRYPLRNRKAPDRYGFD